MSKRFLKMCDCVNTIEEKRPEIINEYIKTEKSKKNKKISIYLLSLILKLFGFSCTIDIHGRIIFFSEKNISRETKAYENCDFITLPKDDASSLVKFLSNYVDSKSGDDVKELGDAAISFERLIDRVDGNVYPN